MFSCYILLTFFFFFFFFNDTATTEIYTLSLHDALPILFPGPARQRRRVRQGAHRCLTSGFRRDGETEDDRLIRGAQSGFRGRRILARLRPGVLRLGDVRRIRREEERSHAGLVDRKSVV